MDAIKFIKESNRMCHSFNSCRECPASDSSGYCKICLCDEYSTEEQLSIVEKWSKEHSVKTKQSVFLEQFPNVKLDENGIIDILPCLLDTKQHQFNGDNCHTFMSCSKCRKEFWMQEVE